MTIDKITPETMDSFFQELSTRERVVGKGSIKKGVKPSTLLTYRSKLNSFFKWLTSREHLGKNPFDSMKAPKVTYQDKKFLEKEKIDILTNTILTKIKWQDAFTRKRNFAIITTFLFAGVRLGELVGLRIDDVNFDKMDLSIRAETSKSKFNRIIPINYKLHQALEDYIAERNKCTYNSPYLFLSAHNRKGLTKDGIKHLIKKLVEESGIKFHVHQLRHTYAMNLLNQGSDISKVQQLLGHSDIRMTAVYLRQKPSKAMRDDVERLTFENLL